MFSIQDDFCIRCGKCCSTPRSIVFSKKELRTIAKRIGINYKNLKHKLNAKSARETLLFIPGAPCPFLENENQCTIYELRPKSCREFPMGTAVLKYSKGDKNIELPAYCGAVTKMLASILKTREFALGK